MKNKRLKFILIAIAILLLIPFIAMQFTDEVNWNLMDFVVAGGLLLTTGLVLNFLMQKVKSPKYRVAIALAVLIVLFLIWAELAVGIFGSPFSGS